jgi:hypothetical protein
MTKIYRVTFTRWSAPPEYPAAHFEPEFDPTVTRVTIHRPGLSIQYTPRPWILAKLTDLIDDLTPTGVEITPTLLAIHFDI